MQPTKSWKQKALEMFADEEKQRQSNRQLAKELGVDESSVRRLINEHDIPRPYKSDSKAISQEELNTLVSNFERNDFQRILILDIETAPAIAAIYGRWKQNIRPANIIEEGYILSYAAKWLGSDVIIAEHYDAENPNKLLNDIYTLLDKANIVVAHNGRKFDMPVIRAEMLLNGMPPHSPVKVFDTLDTARRLFKFPYNDLDTLHKYLCKGEGKQDNGGMETFKKAREGDAEALKTLLEYNVNDVVILEDVYLALRAWDDRHPNINFYADSLTNEIRCPCCYTNNVTKQSKLYRTQMSSYQMYKCNVCGKYMRKRISIKQEFKNAVGAVL